MQRSYDAKTIALAIKVPFKWVDNLLSHHQLPGVSTGHQGLQRRINDEGVIAIELVRMLASDLGVGLARAVELTRSVLSERAAESRVLVAPDLLIVVSRDVIERRLHAQLIDGMEAAALVR